MVLCAGWGPARAEAVQGDQQKFEQDGGADDGGDQGPAPPEDGEGGQPGDGEPDRGGGQCGQRRSGAAEPVAELDEDQHGQPGGHDQEQQ